MRFALNVTVALEAAARAGRIASTRILRSLHGIAEHCIMPAARVRSVETMSCRSQKEHERMRPYHLAALAESQELYS